MPRSTLPWRLRPLVTRMLTSSRGGHATTRLFVVRALSTSPASLYAKPADDGQFSSLKPGSSSSPSQSAASGASSNEDAQSRTSSSGASAAGGRDWLPRRTAPLATAQTLTLFSTSPEALLLTLRSTLQGMLSSLARGASVQGQAGQKPLEQIDAQPALEHGKTFTLLFALSKDLPRDALARAVGLLRGEESTNKEAGIDHVMSERVISTRLGVLSSPVPASLIPPQVLNPAAPPLAPYSTLHSIALSLLPASHAVPFRSKIRGKQASQVGRWPDKKDSWKDERGKVKADMIGEMAGEALPEDAERTGSETPGWRKVWGKENIFSELPAELERFASSAEEGQKESLLSTILFSDPSPQGLLEGLDVQFPHASHVGVLAPATPFETGRDQTIFFRQSSKEDEISSEGAVGLALIGGSGSGKGESKDGARGLKVTTKFEGLKELGPRRRMTGARGNIISSLENGNATQQFLRDIQALSSTTTKSQTSTAMDKDEERDISKGMSKEDEYYLGVFDGPTEGKPFVLARILSGHPSRGSLSVDTDVELGSSGSTSASESGETPERPRYVQFFQADPDLSALQLPSALDIPGPNPGDWASPRFLFLTPSLNTLESHAGVVSPSTAAEGEEVKGKRKAQVLALPNMFVVASDRGWISRKAPLNSAAAKGEQGKSTNVPGSSVMLSLVVDDE